MSSEKRQQARTQGRYSKERDSTGLSKSCSFKKDKSYKSNSERQSNSFPFDDGRSHFPELDQIKHPKELCFKKPTIHVLSDTENGQSRIFFDPKFLEQMEADEYFATLLGSIDWNEKDVVINGQKVPQPRLVAWFGPLPYTYAGLTLEPQEFPDDILRIKREIEHALRSQKINVELNSVLLNLYRDEKDSVAWHSDDEITMGICPTIASLSLGQSRRFELRHKTEDKFAAAEFVIHLDHGSLIVMDGVMQTDWQHRVPKEFHSRKQRINLTFRTVYSLDKVDYPLSQPSDVKAKLVVDRISREKPFVYKEEGFPTLGSSSNNEPKCQRERIQGQRYSNPNTPVDPNTLAEKILPNEVVMEDSNLKHNIKENKVSERKYSSKRYSPDVETQNSNFQQKKNKNMKAPGLNKRNTEGVKQKFVELTDENRSQTNYDNSDYLSSNDYIPQSNSELKQHNSKPFKKNKSFRQKGNKMNSESPSLIDQSPKHNTESKPYNEAIEKSGSFRQRRSKKDVESLSYNDLSSHLDPEPQQTDIKSFEKNANSPHKRNTNCPKRNLQCHTVTKKDESFQRKRSQEFNESLSSIDQSVHHDVESKEYNEESDENNESLQQNIYEANIDSPKLTDQSLQRDTKSKHRDDEKSVTSLQKGKEQNIVLISCIVEVPDNDIQPVKHSLDSIETPESKDSVTESFESQACKLENIHQVKKGFESSDPIIFDENYSAECKRLCGIYAYIKENEDYIPFSTRDREELDVLFTVVDHSGGPLRLKVLTKVCDRMIRIKQFAENRYNRPNSDYYPYSNRNDQQYGRYYNRTFYKQ